MSIQKYGYNPESLQNDKIENFEKALELQTKLINIKLIDMQSAFGGMSDELEKHNNETNNLFDVEEINFDDGETKVVVNAK